MHTYTYLNVVENNVVLREHIFTGSGSLMSCFPTAYVENADFQLLPKDTIMWQVKKEIDTNFARTNPAINQSMTAD